MEARIIAYIIGHQSEITSRALNDNELAQTLIIKYQEYQTALQALDNAKEALRAAVRAYQEEVASEEEE